VYARSVAPTSHTTTSWRPCPIRHCCPVGEAMEILGVRAGMSSELKQTRPGVGVTAGVKPVARA